MSDKKKTFPYTKFGQTLEVEIATVTGGRLDNPPKGSWDYEVWIESAEDWYIFGTKKYVNFTIRIVNKGMWFKAKERIGIN
ncbi:hypothetical protein LCGC14_0405610 [marine sediment metagenome]|uniref:Uncharacterized protein n=1 Tax=marine sediment metagenome TaxID=412755 RepID=A0A0F9TDJ2_9ZZZZ|nr:hypothetical protein [archaeon]